MPDVSTVTLARNAMATRFEVVLHGEDPIRLRAAGEEALQEIERLESQLSLFRPSSEIAHLNARAAKEPVLVTPVLFGLLQQARALALETGGAFDITIGSLVRRWGFTAGGGRLPSEEELAAARECVGMEHVELDPQGFTVRFRREGVMLDLGAIGKGFAIDKAVELLRDAGVSSALIHGGTSTVYAIGSPPDKECWAVGLPIPTDSLLSDRLALRPDTGGLTRPLYTYDDRTTARTLKIPLKDEALSVSAIWGRFFEHKGETLGHIIDPRTGSPAKSASLAAVALPSATESDALSTALLTLGPKGHTTVSQLRPSIRTLVATGQGDSFHALSHGFRLAYA